MIYFVFDVKSQVPYSRSHHAHVCLSHCSVTTSIVSIDFCFWFFVSDSHVLVSDSRVLVSDSYFLIRGFLIRSFLVSDSRAFGF